MTPLKTCVWMFFVILPAVAGAQRLPQGVIPEHYDLSFTPDLEKATFLGEETIQVQVLRPAASIVLNATELQLQDVTVIQGEKTQSAQASFQAEKEQVTLSVDSPLASGPASIHIKFSGILNDKLRGFYLAKTRLRNYAVTQFEPTAARSAFPSFDEPAFKARFDITLIVDNADTAISNGRLIADVSGPGADKHTLKFSTTSKMSSYLVAMAVGDFQCSEGIADNIPIRVCGTPDKKPLHAAALRYAEEILKYYNQYYGLPYPFGKLDIVGAPDFEAGAMENTGAIFYRESLLFIDDNHSSVDSHQAVFEVLAHEMAHQWFGDLVTMKWWDNIWLNEGFATWMALKPSQTLHPEWNATLDAVRATNAALNFDALKNTHPIHARVDTPDEINELFDTISYEKGAAVLRMVESYVSPDVFRRGVNVYLRKFAYGNATAEDFWSTLAQASSRPVDKIMPTFVEQAGEPLVTVRTGCVTPPASRAPSRKSKRSRKPVSPHPKTEITLSQQRLWADPSAPKSNELWTVPVCIRTGEAKPFCQIFSQREQTVPVVGCSSWVFVNASASGYYRTQYDSASLQKLSSIATTELATTERISLLSDEAALVHGGQESVAKYLDLVAAMNQDAERVVVESYRGTLFDIHDYLLTEPGSAAFHSWIRANFGPMFKKIGWTPASAESADTGELRASLIFILGTLGQDPEIVRHSAELARRYVNDPRAMDPSIVRSVLQVAAASGDAELFNVYMAALHDPAKTPEELSDVASALGQFTDVQLMDRWLQSAVAPETRNQNTAGYFAASLSNPGAQRAAWAWIKAHWPQVEAKLTMSSGGRIVAATRSFCDAAMRDDVRQFFSEHKVASSERTLKQSIEHIDACISFREHQQQDFSVWLAQHPARER